MLIESLPSAEVRPNVYRLGETNAEININTPEENAGALISLAQQATRNINIFTQDLDSAVFDNTNFVKALSQMAINDTRTVVRILVHDSMQAVRTGHGLLKLAQSMPGSFFIRNPSRLYQHIRCTYMTADSLGYVYRDKAQRSNYDAAVNFMSPNRAAILDDNFMEVWEQSTVDRNVRRLHI